MEPDTTRDYRGRHRKFLRWLAEDPLPPVDFVSVALEHGLLTEEQIREARSLAARAPSPVPLEEILLKQGYLRSVDFLRVQELMGGAPADAGHNVPWEWIGKYRIVRELGRGGMAIVYEAEDPELQRKVAVKVQRETSNDAALSRRADREAAIAAQLRHPNIVAVHDAGVWTRPDGSITHYIVMDLVEGQTLAEILSERQTPLRTLIEILIQVAKAVTFAHEAGVVHRDLKPANVIVDAHGRPILTDFGLAKASMFSVNLTKTSEQIGTPQYMAPEQVEGRSGEIDQRTDVYAMGVILYEILTGRAPFTGHTPEKLYHHILNVDPARPTRLNRTVDPDIEAVCLKALEKDRRHRYATATAFANDLQRWLAGEPILASRMGWGRRVARRLRRNRILVAAGTALTLTLFAGAATIGWMELRNRKRLESEREAHRRREEYLQQLGTLWKAITEAKNELLSERVSAERARKDVEDLQRQVELLTRRSPEEPHGYYILAQARLCLGDLDGAEEYARRSVTKRPDFRPGWLLLGVVKVRQYSNSLYVLDGSSPPGETARLLDEASLAFDRGGEPTRNSTWGLAQTREDLVMERVARALRLRIIDRKPEEARKLLLEEWEEYRSEEYAFWIGHWSQKTAEKMRWFALALDRAPRHADVLLHRGNTREESGDLEGAIADYTRAIEVRPEFAEAYTDRGIAEDALGRYDRAIADFDRAIQINEHFATPYNNRGMAKDHLGRHEEAIVDYDRAIEIDPDFAQAYYNRGLTKDVLGRIKEAVADYDRAIEIKKDFAAAYHNRGLARHALGRFDQALADFDRLLEIRKDDPNACFCRGNTKLALGRHKEAIADFDRAIAIKKDYGEAYVNRGAAKVDLGRFEDAVADFDRAIAIRKDDATVYLNRGNAMCGLGRHEEAVADYDRAIEIRGNYPEAYSNRGEAKEVLGRFKEAVADYSLALSIASPNWRYRRDTEQLLEDVRRRIASSSPK